MSSGSTPSVAQSFVNRTVCTPQTVSLCCTSNTAESAEAEEEANIRRRRIAFYERCGCEMTKTKSLLYGVDFNILVLPIAQPVPEAKVVLHELENIYHVMFDDELYKRVCHPFIAE